MSTAHPKTAPALDRPLDPKSGSRIAYWGVAIALAVLATIVFWKFNGRPEPAAPLTRVEKAWYTVDEGATRFADDKNKLVPFDYNGKPAYRCWVYTCDDGKTDFVAYLERLSPDAKQRLEGIRTSKQPANVSDIEQLMNTGVEVKRPGDATWIAASTPRGVEVREPTCPSGKHPQLVLPTSSNR
jgi:hypothetical protein